MRSINRMFSLPIHQEGIKSTLRIRPLIMLAIQVLSRAYNTIILRIRFLAGSQVL
jgi:flagellar biosynthesis protein FlhB